MRQLSFVVFLVAALAACGDNNSGSPDARPRPDADEDIIDAAGDDDVDAPLAPDANVDAAPPPDANVDADPGPDVNAQIAAVRAATDDIPIDLPIEGAMVTFLKPQIGSTTNDPAGFTIQGSQAGPAIFVSVDPTTLSPAPAIGDTVSFNVTLKDTIGGSPRAMTIAGYTRDATGGSVEALVKDVSAATDLVTAIDDYDAELIDIAGTITDTFSGSGTGFQRALFTTTGFPTQDTNLQFRVPTTLRESLELDVGCTFTLNNTPVGRFNAQAQVAAFTAGDLTFDCLDPVVTNAVSLSPTSVRVTFSRNILASSVMANGSQFTFTAGLTASAATVSGREVTLTTSAQTSGAMYIVTVANTVTDLSGAGVGTPNTAMFGGFVTPAVVRINELNANITGGCDLIELRVVTGGSMTGFRLTERTGSAGDELSFTFPAFTVATNDLIVVHMSQANPACNVGGATAETTAVNEQAAATFAGNYDTAFDFWAADTGLVATDNVLTLLDAASTIVDAVLVTDADDGMLAAANSEAAAAAAATAGQWHNNGGGTPAGGYVDGDFHAHAALDLNGTGTTAGGTSIQRLDNTDDNEKADWNDATTTVQANTFGALNAGQTAF